MVDEIHGIDSKLFQISPVKRVREVSPRPQDRRKGRDTYTESDEPGLVSMREYFRENKDKRKKAPPKRMKILHTDEENSEERSKNEHASKHIDIII